ncbi:hypothetical protein EVAR_62803_1 [Eumeta japonica]|uniref:Uncharacterized protein n=1 Tax=Eumeta variegata TaxID=151549 RepID=A0A4C1ZQ11_EUMVA|nr:hypothetical protein EVAR_62803_1 [Eumeta japonica]
MGLTIPEAGWNLECCSLHLNGQDNRCRCGGYVACGRMTPSMQTKGKGQKNDDTLISFSIANHRRGARAVAEGR